MSEANPNEYCPDPSPSQSNVEDKLHRRAEQSSKLLEHAVDWAEMTVAFLLAMVIVVAVVFVLLSAIQLVSDFKPEGVSGVIKSVLDTFIIIELFRITIAYVRHRDVIPTVLETALVVAAREIVVIEAGAKDPLAAAAVAGTLLAVGFTWFLLRRSVSQECD